jgi:hypothetical protein
VHNADLLAANLLGVLEGVAEDALRSLASDELDRLHNTVHDNVLNSGVFTLGVLTDQDNVDIVVWGLVTSNALAGTEVGEEVERSAESQVEGDVALADGCSERTLESDVVALDALNGGVWDRGLAVLEDWGNIDGLPLDRGVGGGEDVLDGLSNLRTDTVSFDE